MMLKPPRDLRASQRLIDYLKGFEVLKLKAYLPTPNDKWTIGWGHTRDVFEGMTTTEAQAEIFLAQDIGVAEGAVHSLVTVGLSQQQYDALVSLVFNIGTGNFLTSTLLKILNEGNYEGVPAQMSRWIKQKGKTVNGLINRRKADIAIWNSGEYVVP